MKRRHLLLTLLLAFVMPWAAMAQTQTLTVFDEVGTINNDYVPFHGLYADYGTRTQFIIPATELGEMAGGTISKLTFYNYFESLDYDEGVSVYMKEVDFTAFGQSPTMEDWSLMTTVYIGTIGVTDNQMVIELETPYVYNGDNLMIGFQVTTWGNNSSYSYWYGEDQDENVITALCNDANSNHTWNEAINSFHFLPKTTFTYIEPCHVPTNLTCTAYTSTTATLSWTPSGNETEWVVQCCVDDEFMCGHAGMFDVSGTPSITLEEFVTGHTYYARVKANCGEGNESEWSNTCAFTPSNCPSPTGLSIVEVTTEWIHFQFDSEIGAVYQYALSGGVPEDYLFEGNTGTGNSDVYYVYYPLNGFDLNTDYVVYVRRKCGEGEYSSFATAPFTTLDQCAEMPTNLAVSNVTLSTAVVSWSEVPYVNSYTMRRREANVGEPVFTEGFENGLGDWIFYSTNHANDIGSTGSQFPAGIYPSAAHSGDNGFRFSSFQNYVDPGEQNASYWQYLTSPEFALTNPSTLRFYFKKGYEYTEESLYVGYLTELDDPEAIAYVSQDIHPTDEWQLYELALPVEAKKVFFSYYGENTWYVNLDDISITPAGPWTEVTGITSTNATLSGLSLNTEYQVQVKNDCSDDDWSDMVSFTTQSCTYPVPYTWDFEGPEENYLPLCWTRLGASAYPGTMHPHPGYSYSPDHALEFYSNSNANDVNEIAVLPAFESALNTLSVSFYAKLNYGSSGSLKVGYVIDPDDANTFVTLKSIEPTTEYEKYIVYLNEVPANVRLAFKTLYEGTNFAIVVDDVTVEEFTCEAVTDLAVIEIGPNYVDLAWNAQSDTYYRVYYTDENNQTYYQITSQSPYRLHSLDSDMHYNIKLTPECNVVNSNPFDMNLVATVEAVTTPCIAPADVEVSDILHTSATVSWTGENESYIMSYRTAKAPNGVVLFKEDFEDETSFGNWVFTSMNETNASTAGRRAEAAHSDSYGFRFSSYNSIENESSETYDQYLVSPELTVTGLLQFYIKKTNFAPENLYVGYSTTTNELSAFTWTEDIVPTEEWQDYLLELPDNVKYIAFHYFGDGKYYVYIDDIAIQEMSPEGSWQTVDVTDNTTTANLSGLTFGTKYDVKVQASCGAESEVVSFTTLSENYKFFVTEGNWNEPDNWFPVGVPTIDQDVELRTNVTIPSGCEAFARSIKGTGSGVVNHTITIEDGGKLKHLNSDVFVTVKKAIRGYITNYDPDTHNNGDYYLIANPMRYNFTPSQDGSDGFLVGNYDLYSFDYTKDLEWRNFKGSEFSYIESSTYYPYGYLYANETGTTLTFIGRVNAYTGSKSKAIYYPSDPSAFDFPGWYLVGNPYLYDAYLSSESSNGIAQPYIKMNAAGDGFENVAAGTPIAPLEGFFYQGKPSDLYVYVVTTEPAIPSNRKLDINLRCDGKQLDNAILVFGGEQSLGKFTFREGSSKVYMPVEGKDLAITSVEGQVGEMPVNFKAEKNGTYTLSFANKDVTFSYLHLIDNLTGADVDLLNPETVIAGADPQSPTVSYTFTAKTTDYESRFKLLFATGSSASPETDTFGFINGSGNFCVFGIEGEATLQVIDMMGHVISSETFSGSYEKRINGAPGVYMVRLINGNDVRVQKVVVR